MFRLKVFITGASSGLGAALAAHYAASGASLGLVARRGDSLRKLAGSLNVPCTIYTADVGDTAEMARIADDYCSKHAVPDIVIANAGVSSGTLGGDPEDLAVLERILRTNVLGLAATLAPIGLLVAATGVGAIPIPGIVPVVAVAGAGHRVSGLRGRPIE